MPPPIPTPHDFQASLKLATSYLTDRSILLSLPDHPTIPSPTTISSSLLALPTSLPETGLGTLDTTRYILDNIVDACQVGHAGGKNFSFVTGGVLPASQVAEVILSSLDENVQVTQPNATISTAIESLTTLLVLDLLRIPRSTFEGRSITTGATASNILGFACARDALAARLQHPSLPPNYSIAEHGYLPITSSGVPKPLIEVLSVKPHGSILKAAAVTGIGRLNVVHVGLTSSSKDGRQDNADPYDLAFDLEETERRMRTAREEGRAVIVAVVLGEVNTGGMTPDIPALAALCKTHSAWLHIDAAFGGFGALLPGREELSEWMAMADSLTVDGEAGCGKAKAAKMLSFFRHPMDNPAHKWLQAPYDTALFYTRSLSSLTRSFGPSPTLGAPAYLASTSTSLEPPIGLSDAESARWHQLRDWQVNVESRLNVGIENSRRFRGLGLFSGLMEQGREGFVDIVTRNCAFACNLAAWLLDTSPTGGARYYTLLNGRSTPPTVPLNIVLFRARPETRFSTGQGLVDAINASRQIYVSGTAWDGKPAVRVAVSNWRTGTRDGKRDDVLDVVKKVLVEVMESGKA